MFSGKTSALICGVEADSAASQGRVLLKHAIDDRDGAHEVIRSRTGLTLEKARRVASLDDVTVHPHTLYAVDEAQFFDESLLRLLHRIAARESARLLIAGLDRDFQGNPFGFVRQLAIEALQLPIPAEIHQLHSRCSRAVPDPQTGKWSRCCDPAAFSQRLYNGTPSSESRILVGGESLYQPACAKHHSIHPESASRWHEGLTER